MEGQSLALFFALNGGAVVLLFFVVIWQRARNTQLERELDRVSKVAVRGQRSSTDYPLTSLVEHAPFPMCYANDKGDIRSASASFHRLAGSPVETLKAFGKATGTQLSARKGTSHERVVLRGTKNEDLRHFSLVSWPVSSKYERIGTMYALLEHSSAVRHARDQHSFNQEILRLQGALLADGTHASDPTVLQELRDLNEFLLESYRGKPQRTKEIFDLAPVVEGVLSEYRPHFRKHHITLTATLPKEGFVAGFAEECTEVVRLLVAGVAEYAQPHDALRLHLGRSEDIMVLSITLPGSHGSLSDTFAFGSKTAQRQGRARLALARLLMGHQHGNLSLTVDDEEMTVAKLSFPAVRR